MCFYSGKYSFISGVSARIKWKDTTTQILLYVYASMTILGLKKKQILFLNSVTTILSDLKGNWKFHFGLNGMHPL